jgi:hypothetical protein
VRQSLSARIKRFISSVKILGDLSADETDLSAPWKNIGNLSEPDIYFWDF